MAFVCGVTPLRVVAAPHRHAALAMTSRPPAPTGGTAVGRARFLRLAAAVAAAAAAGTLTGAGSALAGDPANSSRPDDMSSGRSGLVGGPTPTREDLPERTLRPGESRAQGDAEVAEELSERLRRRANKTKFIYGAM